eukprot:6343160-Amphidinium_carterae.1
MPQLDANVQLFPVVRGGYVTLGALATHLKDMASCAGNLPKDDTMEKLAQDFLKSPVFHLTSGAVQEERYACGLQPINMRLQRLAAALCLLDRHCRFSLEGKITSSCGRQQLLYYMDVAAYDETPMFSAVHDGGAGSSFGNAAGLEESVHRDIAWMKKYNVSVRNPTQVTKLLQTQLGFALLVSSQQQMLAIIGQTHCPLQVMQSTSAPCLEKCLNIVGAVSTASDGFKLKCRGAATDKAGSNLKAERHLAMARGQNWTNIHIMCELHIISTCFKKCFDGLMSKHVSGMVWTALCCRQGGGMVAMRMAIRSVIQARLQIKVGHLSESALAYKAAMSGLFLEEQSGGLVKTVLLFQILNGDWRDEIAIVHLVFFQILSNPANLVAAARDDVGRPDSGLLEDDNYDGSRAVPGQSDVGALPLESSGDHPDALSGITFAEQNAKQRQSAWNWISTSPWQGLLLIKICIKPFNDMLLHHFHLCGQSWELEQRAAMARAMSTGNMSLASRKYRIVEAALAVEEQ